MVTILLAPSPTQRYFTRAVAEEVSGELRYHVQSGVGIRRAMLEQAKAVQRVPGRGLADLVCQRDQRVALVVISAPRTRALVGLLRTLHIKH